MLSPLIFKRNGASSSKRDSTKCQRRIYMMRPYSSWTCSFTTFTMRLSQIKPSIQRQSHLLTYQLKLSSFWLRKHKRSLKMKRLWFHLRLLSKFSEIFTVNFLSFFICLKKWLTKIKLNSKEWFWTKLNDIYSWETTSTEDVNHVRWSAYSLLWKSDTLIKSSS